MKPTAATDLLVDVSGYFDGSAAGLAFYPMSPCRVVDTRLAAGTFGGPAVTANAGRTFPLFSSACGIPNSAQAFSVNVTAVPQGPLAWLTAWAADLPYPGVSTLNAPDGNVTANAAVIAAKSTGRVSVAAGSTTDVVIDINGYFAPPGTGGMYFYPIPPCRAVADTVGATARDYAVVTGLCPIPATAQIYSLNVTASPQGALGWLSLWPAGAAYPGVSTLNSPGGMVKSNAALVPAGTGGKVSMVASGTTGVTLDVNGYFSASPNEGTYVAVSGSWTAGGTANLTQRFTLHYTSAVGRSDVVYGQALFTPNPTGPDGSHL